MRNADSSELTQRTRRIHTSRRPGTAAPRREFPVPDFIHYALTESTAFKCPYNMNLRTERLETLVLRDPIGTTFPARHLKWRLSQYMTLEPAYETYRNAASCRPQVVALPVRFPQPV